MESLMLRSRRMFVIAGLTLLLASAGGFAACCVDITMPDCDEAQDSDGGGFRYAACGDLCGGIIASCSTKYGFDVWAVPTAESADEPYADSKISSIPTRCADMYRCSPTSDQCDVPGFTQYVCEADTWEAFSVAAYAYGVGECP